MTDRAVSEVVGFVISFALVVTLVGATYVGGFSSLQSFAEEEQIDNAERAMRAFAASVEDVERGDAPGRAGELRLQGGQLTVEESARLNVTVATPNGSYSSLSSVGSLAYSRDDATVRLESGAVFRNRRGASVLVREPSFVCSDDVAVVSLVRVRPANNRTSVAGDGAATVVVRLRDRRLLYPGAGTNATDATRVNVTLNRTAEAGGWERYFEDDPGWAGDDREYACDASRVFVRETVVAVRFVR